MEDIISNQAIQLTTSLWLSDIFTSISIVNTDSISCHCGVSQRKTIFLIKLKEMKEAGETAAVQAEWNR